MLRATGCAVRVRMCGGTMYSLPTVADTDSSNVQSKARKTQDYKGLSAAEVFVIEFASGPSPLTLGVYCARVCLRSMLASAPQDTEPMVSIIYVQTAKADVATKVCPAAGRGGSMTQVAPLERQPCGDCVGPPTQHGPTQLSECVCFPAAGRGGSMTQVV